MIILVNADHYGFPPILIEVGEGAVALLADQQPSPLELGLIPWAMRALLLLPFLQIVGVGATLRRLHRWRQDPQRYLSRGRIWGLHILLPLIPNLLLATIPVLLLVSGLIRFTLLFIPDFSWIFLICGGFAGIWAFLRTGLILHTLRKPEAAKRALDGSEHIH